MTVIRHVVFRGRVQGVGFRAHVEDMAARTLVGGWVRNRRDGTVEAVFAGPERAVAEMIKLCRRGPDAAWVDSVDETRAEPDALELRKKGERFSELPTIGRT
jgi:acylphosphatase